MHFKQWLYNNGYGLEPRNGETKEQALTRLSHTCLNGGRLAIPLPSEDKHQNQLFYDKMAAAILKDDPFPISELRTPVFRYYLDFDMKEQYPVSKKEFTIIAQHIQHVLTQVLESTHEHYCFVSTCPNKNLSDGLVKSGFHINFPLLRVDTFIARKLRQILVQYFEQLEDDRLQKRDWGEAIDEEVYVGAGLRMIGADKSHKCPILNCAGKRKKKEKISDDDYCPTCDNLGLIYENRRYFPFLILKGDGTVYSRKMANFMIEDRGFLDEKNMLSFLIKKNSIRTEGDINVTWREPLPSWYKPTPITERIVKKRNPTKYLEDDSLKEEKEMKIYGYSDLERIDSTDPRFIEFQKFMQSMWDVYSDLNIRVFKKTGRRGAKHYSYQIQTYNHYCHNIKREHVSQHVWFHVDQQTLAVYQRCFDCKGYISKNFKKLSQKIVKLLFPEMFEKAMTQHDMIEKSLTPNAKAPTTFEELFEIDDFE